MTDYLKNNRLGVVHYVDGREAWKIGWKGLLYRLRAQVGLPALAALLFGGVPWWWQDALPDKISLSKTSLVWHVAPICAMLVFCAIFLLRRAAIRTQAARSNLHFLIHDARNSTIGVLKRAKSGTGRRKELARKEERQHLESYSKNAAHGIAEIYKNLTNDDTIGCAIRLFVSNPHKDAEEAKCETIGRGGYLSTSRDATSIAISRNEGIPKFFLNPKVARRGVLYYNDLVAATANDLYKKTPNDDIYKGEISCFAVAPINGWDGQQENLIGLLYITSKKKKILDPSYVELIKGHADFLALMYTGIFSALTNADQMPSTSTSEDAVPPTSNGNE